MLEVYGIGNCDTCRKARNWLESAGREFRWHDLREDGVDIARLRHWLEIAGTQALVNRRSTTWRGLDEVAREQAMDPARSAELLAVHPTLIKRPVIESGEAVHVGFTDAVRSSL